MALERRRRRRQKQNYSPSYLVLDLRDLLHGRHGGSDGERGAVGSALSGVGEQEGLKVKVGGRRSRGLFCLLALSLAVFFSVRLCFLSSG